MRIRTFASKLLGIGKLAIFSYILSALAGCNVGVSVDNGVENSSGQVSREANVITGSVGDGPVVGATIIFTDASRNEVARTTSNFEAKYQIALPLGAKYPLTVTAVGGVDLVSGAPPSFDMVSGSVDASERNININPYSTFIIKTASLLGGITSDNIATAKNLVTQRLGFGLDSSIYDPITTETTNDNVANIVKSSETLGEMVRRVSSAFLVAGTVISSNQVINTLAADLVDGVVDGHGIGADARIAAMSTVVSAQVLVEAMRNRLFVDGADATARLDSAIAMIAPTSTARSASVPITAGMVSQARDATKVAEAVSPNSNALVGVASVIEGISNTTSSATEISILIDQNASADFNSAISAVGQASAEELEKINAVASSLAAPVSLPVDPIPVVSPAPASGLGMFELSSATFSVGEAKGAIDITVNRVSGSEGEVSVELRTMTFDGFGTADWASDFGTVYPPVVLTFASGETSKRTSVNISQDSIYEGNETFTVLLQNPRGGASLGGVSKATVTIIDDDPLTSIPVSVSMYPADTEAVSVPIAKLSKPGYLQSVTHPQFGTEIIRVTDNAAFGATNIRHYYSKVTPWNSDGSLLNINRRLIDGKTFKLMRLINNIPGEYRWSHTRPGIIYTVSGLDIAAVDVLNNDKRQLLRTFTGFELCQLGPWEGNISNDDRYVALACKSGVDAYAVVYDIANNAIVSNKKLTTGGWSQLDWLSISQSGNYVLALWNFSTGFGVDVFDRNMTNQRKLVNRPSSHGDLGYDTSGNEVFIQFEGTKGYINVYRLSDGYQYAALGSSAGTKSTDMHLSCRNIKRPGWCYVSTQDTAGTMSREVFAVKIQEGNSIVERFTHHQSTSSIYEAQPQAVPNADGSQVIFASDWGGSEINSYVVRMP